jgi:hypothetical protein
MDNTKDQQNLPVRKEDTEDKINLPGYPLYPASEDIYNKGQLEDNIDPENIFTMKETTEDAIAGTNNEKDFKEDVSGKDLDIPGAELDDQEEIVGSEDEENNYYSLGGDNHNDLDEDKGE